MFRNMLDRLFAPAAPAKLNADEAELALAALLVRVARADGHYRDVERQRIDRILARRQGLSDAEATERRGAAEMIEAEAPDTVRFTRQIKDRISLEDRRQVLAAMWEIAYADDHRAADEETLIRLVAGLLGVSDRDSALVRQQVLNQTDHQP